jgi:hypothetical protein
MSKRVLVVDGLIELYNGCWETAIEEIPRDWELIATRMS